MDRTVYLVNVGKIYKILMNNEPDPHTYQYHHCLYDGKVHNSREFNAPLFNIKKMLGIEHIPIELATYNITTGICKPCRSKSRNQDKNLVDKVKELFK